MKNITQMVKGSVKILGLLFLVSTTLTSCLKDNDNDGYVAPKSALISVINASPDSQPLDFYLDQNRGNNYPISYGNGLDYINAYTGKRTASFYVAGTQTKIKSDTMTLNVDRAYTLYLTNLTATPDFVLLQDAIEKPAAGQAAIRLVNVSPTAPAVDLAIKDGAVLVNNKAYKGFSTFVPVQGNGTYTLEIRQTGTNTVLASIPNANLKSNAVYTVWLQGLAAATDAKKLTAQIQTNAYYNQ
ncbi:MULTISPECIES: DUF4397 domain-containing protein [unclassified Mucilaginibacter]|uniref:DUF4397 domain-containing protein n=1 Tax=unclassified Mucilaginibacter TaxID=2617802 RepID=UPI0031F637D2